MPVLANPFQNFEAIHARIFQVEKQKVGQGVPGAVARTPLGRSGKRRLLGRRERPGALPGRLFRTLSGLKDVVFTILCHRMICSSRIEVY